MRRRTERTRTLQMWWNTLAAMVAAVLTAYVFIAIGLVIVLVLIALAIWLMTRGKENR